MSHKFNFAVAAAILLAISAVGEEARAGAVYSAEAMVFLIITDITVDGLDGIDGLDILGSVDSNVEDINTGIDNSLAEPTVMANSFGEDGGAGHRLLATVEGFAKPPIPPSATDKSYSQSLATARGDTYLFNTTSDSTYAVDFMVDYSVEASASIMQAGLEEALAEAIVGVSTDSLGAIIDARCDADGLEGPPGCVMSDSLGFSLMIGPGESDNVSTGSLAAGTATSIPVPGTLLLLAMGGMLGLGCMTTRRQICLCQRNDKRWVLSNARAVMRALSQIFTKTKPLNLRTQLSC